MQQKIDLKVVKRERLLLLLRMGEEKFYQPLTRTDRITVILYRSGIVLTAVILALSSFFVSKQSPVPAQMGKTVFTLMLLLLYVSTGLSVFFIHLYVNRFHKLLKRLYFVSLICLAALFIVGKGNILALFNNGHAGPLLLLPLSGCIGFITAKEAFCFRLMEGYLIALILPVFLFVLSAGIASSEGAASGLILISILYIVFMVRKAFMPLHYDIGDKSAYV